MMVRFCITEVHEAPSNEKPELAQSALMNSIQAWNVMLSLRQIETRASTTFLFYSTHGLRDPSQRMSCTCSRNLSIEQAQLALFVDGR